MSTSLVARAVSSVRRAAVVACTLGAASAAPSGRAGAQTTPTVSVTCPICERATSVTPTFVVLATDFGPAASLRYTVQVSANAQFAGALELDTTFTSAATVVSVAPARALTGGVRFFYRARVTSDAGANVMSSIVGPFLSPQWVTLLTPPVVAGQPERTLRPRFVWSSPTVNEPPGPWEYEIRITSRSGGAAGLAANVRSDTVFVPGPNALEANTAYTWSVQARLPRTAQGVGITSAVTFTTEDTTLAVTSTQMYSPFPNPFPYVFGGEVLADATCTWFDLRSPAAVSLEVLDLRGAHVRTLLPHPELSGTLPAGRYGRGHVATNERCDPRIQWDGRDDRGGDVPEGVYIIRFRADGILKMRKVTFRGR